MDVWKELSPEDEATVRNAADALVTLVGHLFPSTRRGAELAMSALVVSATALAEVIGVSREQFLAYVSVQFGAVRGDDDAPQH